MSVSSFYGLQTSLRGLLAQQRSIDVTGHNIANASTRGYSRQEATLAASAALTLPAATQNGAGAHLGSGVDVQSYRRVRDTFLDLQYRAQATSLGGNRSRSTALDRAELALAEPSDNGINTQLARFWNAWSDVANHPESPAARQTLVSQAGALVNSFATVDSHLATVRAQAEDEYAALTGPGGDVEAIARELAELNGTIGRFMSAGDTPNDLLDRRDLLLDKLSELGQVSVSESATPGSVVVSFGGAAEPLVTGEAVTWPQELTDPGGRLGALKKLGGPTGEIESYRAQLGAVAAGLADSVNALHQTGSNGTAGPFFSYTPGAAASTLAVAVAPAGVASTTGTAAGANDLARAIAALRGGAADSSYKSFIARVGTDVREAKRLEANSEVLERAVDDRRQSVAGVAMDEEMTNLVRFQRAYQASARAMSTMDEMLDVLINRTGRVGL
ncbi:MAG: flagellar hook-associated protein FlgK [Actinomycetota bacterium]|nr:flagellar hook-associated protein FlgK [Actinomycetota bacterium]